MHIINHYQHFPGAHKFFDTPDALCNFLVQRATFSEEIFPTLATLTAVSSTNPALHEDNLKNFVIFCYDYFEDLLACITFAKNLSFLACIVSNIFAIENALQSKHHFTHNAFEQSYLLRHLTITITHKNLILEIGYMYNANSAFLPRSTFYIFFPKLNLNCLKLIVPNFSSAS